MTEDDAIQRFGLPASPTNRAEIRHLLSEEIAQVEQEEGNQELLKTLCIQLFSLGVVEDALLIWQAKRCNFDTFCGLDVQFLCGAGLEPTKAYLLACSDPLAPDALNWLTGCEEAGDFLYFTPECWIANYRHYFHLEP